MNFDQWFGETTTFVVWQPRLDFCFLLRAFCCDKRTFTRKILEYVSRGSRRNIYWRQGVFLTEPKRVSVHFGLDTAIPRYRSTGAFSSWMCKQEFFAFLFLSALNYSFKRQRIGCGDDVKPCNVWTLVQCTQLARDRSAWKIMVQRSRDPDPHQ